MSNGTLGFIVYSVVVTIVALASIAVLISTYQDKEVNAAPESYRVVTMRVVESPQEYVNFLCGSKEVKNCAIVSSESSELVVCVVYTADARSLKTASATCPTSTTVDRNRKG